MTCAVLGDSIALGVGTALPRCETHATVGISAAGFDARVAEITADQFVISLGSNPGPSDIDHMRAVRSRLHGAVTWLLPPERARDTVLKIAAERGDRVVDVRPFGVPGHIHPTAAGYHALAAEVSS